MGAEKLSTLHFLKCLLPSKACLHGISNFFSTHKPFLSFPGSFVPVLKSSISGGFSWTRHSLWVTGFLLNATVFLPLQRGQEVLAVWNDTAKVAQRVSLCTYLLVIDINAPVTLQCDEGSVTRFQLLGDLPSLSDCPETLLSVLWRYMWH